MKFIPSFTGLVGALFHHLSGTDDTQGFVSFGKLGYGADGTTPTNTTAAVGFPVKLATDGLLAFAGIGGLTDAPAPISAATTAASASNNALLRLIANLLDQPVGAVASQQLDSTGASAPIKYAFADLTATNDIVTAVAGKRIKVLSYSVVCGAVAASIRFQSGGTASISPVMSFGPAGGIVEKDEFGLFQTAAGAKLTALMTGTGPLAVRISYVEY